ncbi:MAG: isopeptide-forming domain-containing fimbrial protein [Leucobacter sp.]
MSLRLFTRGTSSNAVEATPKRRPFRRWIAGTAAGAMIASALVTVGVGANIAAAAGTAPTVSAGSSDTYLAGEDLTLDLAFTGTAGASSQYNLSAGIVLDADVTFVSSGDLLGTPTQYPAGSVLRSGIATATTPDSCAALGLEDAPTPAGACRVPTGMQYWVFENISDLPEGATVSDALTVRPKAGTFPAGDDFPFQVNAYTNSVPQFLPVFPGSSGVSTGAAATGTSNAGVVTDQVPVNALRIEKTEPSPESELLRGVHDHTTTYTLSVYHTGEGDIANARVVDFIPAGLEYLGLGEVDNTRNANGTRGGGLGNSFEYPGALSLEETDPPAELAAWQTSAGETIETVIPTAAEVADYGLVEGAVYTKVTWDLSTLLGVGDSRDTTPGVQQVYSGTEGTPGLLEIRYRAAVPLFENTMDFGYTAATDGQQIANLDNNRGASTRHGSANLNDRAAAANSYTNVAVARGEYNGEDVEDHGSEVIDAVDVRVLKTVNGGEPGAAGSFEQGAYARYGLQLATSEYVSAELGNPNDTADPANDVLRLVDDMADGLCPVFPSGTKVWEEDPENPTGYPNLVIGNYNTTPPVIVDTNLTPGTWNEYLKDAGIDSVCQWESDEADGLADSEAPSGAFISGIAFDPNTGNFMLEFALDPTNALASANATHTVEYSVHQNTRYVDSDGSSDGATGARDTFVNEAEINARTTPISALEGVTSAEGAEADSGPWNAWDDSEASVEAGGTSLTKRVLKRSEGAPDREVIADEPGDSWVQTTEQNMPFQVGDQTWYKIVISPPTGADVRNSVFTDFLPAGVSFDLDTIDDETDRPEDMWIVPGGYDSEEGLPWLGDCQPTTTGDAERLEWLNKFVPLDGMALSGRSLSFDLGASDCFEGSNDRFLPFEADLEIYLKVTVTDPSAFQQVDLAQNLAKFQYWNNAGEVFALRDQAEIELDRTPRLVKGIKSNNNPEGTTNNTFGSNVDGEVVVQGDEVTFRLDVTAPFSSTNEYVIYDLLPEGISAGDVGSYTAATVADVLDSAESELSTPADYTVTAVDYGDPSYPNNIKDAATHQRSVIVWTIDSTIAPSTKAVIDDGVETTPAIDRGFTLGYTLTVPDGADAAGALINQRYVNDASIVQFDADNNVGGESTFFIEGSENVANPPAPEDLDPGQFIFPDSANDTSDPSNIRVADAKMSKTLIATEIGEDTSETPVGLNDLDPNNENDEIVQGELATYLLEVTVPANTTVRNGVLADDEVLRWGGNPNVTPPEGAQRALPYHLASARVWNAPGVVNGVDTPGLAADWSFDPDSGALTFPEYFQNDSADDVTIQVELTLWIDARDASHPSDAGYPNFANGKTLQNTARFNSQTETGGQNPEKTATADVDYITPNPTLAKAVTDPADGIVKPSGEVKYTLTVSNTADRPALFDAVVYDCLPPELTSPTGFDSANGTAEVVSGVNCALTESGEIALDGHGEPEDTGDGTLIKWTLAEPVLGGTSSTLTYTATVHSNVGGGQVFTNGAHLEGYTLPAEIDGNDTTERRGDRIGDAEADVKLTSATIEKSVTPTSAPVGDTVKYTLVTTLPADANYYDVELVDVLPAGMAYVTNSSDVSIEWAGATSGAPTIGQPEVDGQTLTWIAKTDNVDVATWNADRTITITFDVKITDDVESATPRNTAVFSWNAVDGNEGTRDDDEDDAIVTILNPVLQIEKLVDGQDSIERDPNATFDYTLTVSQTDEGNTAAHNITVVDTVPAGVKVTDITPTAASVDAGVADGEGGKITWELDGPLYPESGTDTPKSIELGYKGSFIDSTELSATAYINEVEITEYESFDSDGRTYVPGENGVPPAEDDASVTPLFPYVVPTKTVTVPADGEDYGIAIAGEPFNWTLTIENEGDGTAEDISVTDLLPTNWEYVGNAQISVNGGAPVALTGEPTLTPATVTDGDQQEIVWSPETIREAGATPLDADGVFVITFDATPTEWALGEAGTGIGINVHTNMVSVTATDTQGNPENADNEYVGEDDEADAYIAEADLLLVKDALGGVIDSGDTETNLYGLETGTWVPGQSANADYAQPQWQLTVTNQGPDASVGPYVYEDTQTLPEGVTVGTWSALYYPADGSGAQTPSLTVTGEGTADAPYIFTVGDEHTVLDADGDASIVLTADVTIAAGATASGSELSNIADVRGETYENPDNFGDNKDEAEKQLTAVADLAIVKEFAPVTGDRNAGDPISWSLVVSNDGPSDSVSSAAEPITVTDAVPAEIVNVGQLEGTDLPAGWALDITGNDITLTLTPDAVFPATGVGSTVEFNFSGSIGASVEAGTEILNEATVHPGETPDPDPSNNEDEDETEPITSITSVGANKYRVELVDGEWVPVAAPADVTAGTEISYRLAITNTGTADARGVTLTDELPSELDYVSWVAQAPADGWTFGQTDQTLTFSNDQNLAPGATASVIVTVMINESATDDIENTVCVAADDVVRDGDDCATDTTGTGKMVDWALEKSHTVPATGAVNAGETVRYLLQVHNNGPSASAGPITVTDVLPVGFTYGDNVAATGLGTITNTVVDTTPEGLDRVTWTIEASGAEFPTGQDVVTIAFDALVGDDVAPGIYTNDARVDGVNGEPGDDPSNNDDDDEIPVVRAATMSIEKEVLTTSGEWVEVAEHAAGTEVTWRVLITNHGPSAAPVTFTDTPPTGVTITSMAGDGWECEVADLSCEYTANGALHPVGQSEIVMTSDLAPGVQPTDLPGLVNWGEIAWVDDTTEDPSDRDDAAITTVRSADLGIAKTALDSEGNETTTVIAGGALWYQLDLWNEGPRDAVAPLIVNDTLPEGISFVGLSGDSAASWTAEVDPADSQTVTFTRTPASGIAVGGEAPSIVFEVRVSETVAAGAELDNVASIDEETLEINGDPVDNPEEAPDSDNAVVTAERQIDLGIVKSHDAEAVRVGDELPFTLLVTNYGPSEATGITVTDTVPAGLEVVSETGPVLDEAGDPTGWTIDEIVLNDETDPAGGANVTASYESPLLTGEQAAPLVITTLVTPAAYDGVVNVASVTGNEPEPDPDPNPNEDEDPVIVPPLVTLVVEKTAVENEFQVGKTGTFKIEVSNLGPTADPGPITVTDTLPAGLTFQSSPDTGVSTSGSTVTWVIEEGLDVGESVTLTLVVNVAQGAYPEVTNTVVIDSPSEKTPESVLEDDETVPVKAADPLVVTGGDAAAMWLLLALLLGLGGGALLLRKRRDTQPMIDA